MIFIAIFLIGFFIGHYVAILGIRSEIRDVNAELTRLKWAYDIIKETKEDAVQK